jgi:hypothetical protein
MTARDELGYGHAARRIGRFMAVIGALGTVAALALGGWKVGAGFLLGAVLSGVNYRWLRQLVEGLGGKPARGSVFLAFRYLLLGGVGYVILLYSPLNMTAVLTGLFVLIAAVFVELIFEIVYARK